MAGRNFLFVPGPTNVPERIQRAMMVSMEDHRSPNFPHLTHTIMAGLKDIFRSKNGTPFIFPSSGTGVLGSGTDQHTVARRQSLGGTIWPIQPFVD